MAIRPGDCTFISGRVFDDGNGQHGWGVIAYATPTAGQARPVGYALGFTGSGPVSGGGISSLYTHGALERVGNALYHLGTIPLWIGAAPFAVHLSVLDVEDPTEMQVPYGQQITANNTYALPVYLRTDGERLYLWMHYTALGRWACQVRSLADPFHPAPVGTLTWTAPANPDRHGQWHHAVSRGALYVLEPINWGLEVWECADPAGLSRATTLPLPAQTDPEARIACDDSYLAVGIRHFRDGAWVSALIIYDISDRLNPVELGRIEEEPLLGGPRRQPIGIRGGHLIYTDNTPRLWIMDLATQAITGQSEPLWQATIDWDLRDGLLMRKVRDTQTFQPERVFEGGAISSLARLPANLAFYLRGYGWYPGGWIGPPEDLGHIIAIYGPGIVAGLQTSGGGIDMWTDATGGIWTAWADGGCIYAARLSTCAQGGDTWDTPVQVAMQDGVAAVGISGHGDRIHVSAQLSDGSVVEWRSVSGGAGWEGPFRISA